MLNSSVIRCYVTKSTGINLGQVTSVSLALTHWPWLGKAGCCQLTAVLSPVLSSVPASQEIGPLGDRGSAGSVSGGPDRRPGLRHPHGQRARRWILPRHHRKSSASRSSSTRSCCFTKAFSGIFVLAAEFRSVPGHRWHPPGGKPPLDGEFSKPAN